MSDAVDPPSLPRRPARTTIAAAALIALHLALGLWCARRMSVTYDEAAHLPAGLAYWRAGALEIYDLSPPLPRYLAAAPLALFGGATLPSVGPAASIPTADRHWAYAAAFRRANATHYQQMFLAGRAMITLLSCCGAAIAFAWTRRLAGDVAGIVACAMYVACPNVVGYASIVGTDSPAAVALLAAAWRLDRFLRRPTLGNGLLATTLLAAVPMVKFSLLAAWPIGVAILVGAAIGRRIAWRAALLPIAALVPLAFAACWLTYVGQHGGASLADLGATTSAPTAWLDRHGLGGIARAFPRPLVEGFDRQWFEAAGQFDGYLFGRGYPGATWGYYPTAALCKWTTGAIATFALALGLCVRRRAWPAVVPATFAIGYAACFTFGTQINLSGRYLLPALPLAYVASIATVWRLGGRTARGWALAGVGLAAVEGLASMPDPIGFYSLAARVTGIANRGFVDADWGQSLIALREWMRSNGVGRVRLAYFGSVDPKVYGIAFDEFDDAKSDAEWLALSGQLAQGTTTNLVTVDGWVRQVTPHAMIAYRLRETPPDARAGQLYLYRLRPRHDE